MPASRIQIDYQTRLLSEAGLIWSIDCATKDEPFAMMPVRLTMAGHEYLDSIRDDKVWRRTKTAAQTIGSFSLEALSALARGFMREKIRKHTGIEVDI